MRLLTGPVETEPAARAPSIARPLAVVAATAALGAGVGLAAETWLGAAGGIGHALASASLHAGFLAAGWVVALDGQRGWRGPALRGAAALVLAALATRVSLAGALAYLLVPLVLARDAGAWRPRLERIGWHLPCAPRAILLGAAAGTFLGLHLIIAASLTLGYSVSVPDGGRYLAALAYDVGANALTAEWLFRGAIFSALWRRWSFWPAALVSTACALVRYLLDPALPQAIEAMAGATFYLSLLGLACCALRAWSGSLVPGYCATVAFFAAYRTLLV
jgi:membrane protease YdiL (CAAX protease family)